jgi:uncharacterized protein (TIGR03067 family)
MTRFRGLAVVAVAAVAVGGVWAEDKKDAPKFDAAKLEGKWMVTEMTKMGEKVDTKDMKDPVVVTKDSITTKTGGGEFVFKYTIDAKTDPAGIDMEITSETFKGTKAVGIIKLDGDKLMLAYDFDPEAKTPPRPKAFESKKDSKTFNYVLTRVKEEKKDEKKVEKKEDK